MRFTSKISMDDLKMKDFISLAFRAYKENLNGLPSFCRLVMLEVFECCDYETGSISITSLDKLARENFYVEPARGRQKEEINGDTLRNALRTIKKAKSEYFQFTTVNQKIVIKMPFLRDLFQSFFNETQEAASILAADVAAVTTLTQSSESPVFDPIVTADVAEVLAAASSSDSNNAPTHACVKTNPTKPNNNNSVLDEVDSKQPIADDFYPSQFIIEKAMGMGLSKVIEPAEIEKFIAFNKATGSLWKNYDYVFLTWLQRDAEREQAKALAEQQVKPKYSFNTNHTGHLNHGQSRNNEKSTASQRVIDAYRKDGLEFCARTNRFTERANTSTHAVPIQYIDIDSLGPID